MEIEEVSYVDNAANGRKFLVVKNVSGGAMTTSGNDSDSKADSKTKPGVTKEEDTQQLSLSKDVQTAVAEMLVKGLERLVGLSERLKTSKTIEPDASEAMNILPSELEQELREVMGLFGTTLSKYTAAPAAADGSVSKTLLSIGEVAITLAKATETKDTLSDDTLDQTKRLSGLLTALIEKHTAKTDDAGSDGTDSSSSSSTEEDNVSDVEKRRLTASQVSELSDMQKAIKDLKKKMDALLKQFGDASPPAKTNKNEDELGMQEIQSQLAALTSAVQTLANPKPDAESNNAPGGEEDKVEKRLKEAEGQIAELSAKLAKAVEEPPGRASTTPVKKDDDGEKTNVFPLYYNHPVHDPQAESKG
jgi:hypothetical protein